MNEEEYPSPDPATMEKLWQEYNERTKHPTKTVDKETYHRKMHHRYNEMKALRERVASLESELEEVRSERDEARDISRRNSVMVDRSKSKTDEEPSGGSDGLPNTEERGGTSQVHLERSASTLSIPQPATSPRSKQASGISAEELTLREKCFKLERSLALAKETIDRLQAKILSLHNSDQSKIDELRAKLRLEQEASQVLAVQLRETNAAFKTATDELVATQVALDKEREERQVAIEQIQAETNQFITDHKRKELQSRVKSVVRTLGKEALRQKMEALHTRTLMAEHHMRAAQLEVAKLKAEREYQQAELDAILASREIKYHSLAPDDGGIPGILGRSTILYHGTRLLNDQYLLVRMLYEDNRASITKSMIDGTTREPVTDLEDGFSVHVIVYEAFTAQDDYLTFHLRDIQRLVPDCEKYLATFADRRHERYLELAELLFSQCHIGYKNGHLVLTERPSSALEAASRERTEVTIYRGSRFVTVADSDTCILVDLVVNEVYMPSMSQLWWLEIQATAIDTGHESVLKVDHQLLKSCCATFASYRPSESVGSGMVDEYELYGVHAELLESVFNQVQWHPTTASLWIESALTEEQSDESQECAQQPQDPDSNENPPVIPTESRPKSIHKESSDTAQVLDHCSIVGVEGIFYCLRIQELWDGELMLRITMEEPDATIEGYEMVLCESQLVKIAAYLFRSGLCDEDHSRIVKYGLPGSLQGPMARVLKKHLRPLRNEMCGDTSVICSPAKQSMRKKQKISLASLLAEMTQNSDSDDPISTKWVKLPAPCRLLGRPFQEVQIMGGGPSEEAIQAMFNDLQENPTLLTRRERFGCRYETKCDFATVTTYSGFPKAPERILLSVCPLESSAVLIVLTQGSVLEALASLGLRWIS
ncbi:hypothetical protein Poli38472_003054 [Pythium oligandrum]|uniref:Uncharacterized protein n=1 Tax=Pythium oligandrum TaxID=41045 RepID=A0A8K1C5U6_PYTOL|nr:hypothetical protein Poli38472_003054 [Pythium oligandrum]|eukprot:TMW57129.1 hypothetical protein Poli38472_003054 [Pythium oligandrum]